MTNALAYTQLTSCHAGQHKYRHAGQVSQPGITQARSCHTRSGKQAYYSFIDPGRMKGWVGLVGWPVVDGLPTQWSPVGCRPSAGQGQFAGQRPAFCQLCYATNRWWKGFPGQRSKVKIIMCERCDGAEV